MNDHRPLAPAQLCWHCDPAEFDFETTNDLPDLDDIIGQERALEAMRFGIGIRREGYNLFVLGSSGVGKRTSVERFLQQRSAAEPRPSDWCYVNNFDDPNKPHAIELPAGRGLKFHDDMDELLEELRTAIPAALKSPAHKERVESIERETKEQQEAAFQTLAEKATARHIQLMRTSGGFALAPIFEGKVISQDEFAHLPQATQEEIERSVAELQEELQNLVESVPHNRRLMRDKIKKINREATSIAIGQSIAQIRKQYADLPAVLEYLVAVERDVIENADDFCVPDEEPMMPFGMPMPRRDSFDEYRANLIVDNSETPGAPVVYEDHPTFQNLLGRVEHESQMGTLLTDFTLIKSGALHRANGGYLVVDVLRLLQQPFAWEGLKRCLQSGVIKIESLAETLSLISTVSLEPEPIPLNVKVVLLGERMLYYLLCEYDQDFVALFKVAADFEEQMERTPENCRLYARMIATLARREQQRPLDRSAVAAVLEHSARVADDSQRLTTHMRTIADLMREADYWASCDGASIVRREHVRVAIDKSIHRVDRLRERIQEEIQRGTLMIDTEGAKVAQINGLSVLQLGNFAFGRPSRITATARLGKGEVIDIEREVALGGAIHSKGVLILGSFLAARYAPDHPLSLTASVVFEQSYGPIDGDSASVAELCALLSALADVPIRQSLAVTGSINQHGSVQPIGGVNEKIEGFFDVCRVRGLNGQHGVLIPASNVKHLMLRDDVVAAASGGQFHIYAIETIDQAIGLLTGLPAGERQPDGSFPAGSVNQRVQARLLEMFHLRQKYGSESAPSKAAGSP
jgi:lon-related putative ATP-dependent protease